MRKETSWNSWRDEKIEPQEFENIPTEGFVLNKKVGGHQYHYDMRQTYVRVYDPRGFEFEITVPNLLFILENTNSIKGKGLEGEFVYGWSGADILLIPTSSPNFEELTQFNELLYKQNYIKPKDLKIGATYQTSDNKELIYMGKYDSYTYWSGQPKGKQFYFAKINGEEIYFTLYKNISKKLINVIDENCSENYAKIFDELEYSTYYSPIDDAKDEYFTYSIEEFEKLLKEKDWHSRCYSKEDGCFQEYILRTRDNNLVEYYVNYNYCWNKNKTDTLENVFNILQPYYLNKYLANGKLHGRK